MQPHKSRRIALPFEPWMEYGACRSYDPLTFFPQPNDYMAAESAKQICDSCIQSEQCLEYALSHMINDGIWGATSRDDRIAIRKSRRLLAEQQLRKAE